VPPGWVVRTEGNGRSPRRRGTTPVVIATAMLWLLAGAVAIGVRQSCPVDSSGNATTCAAGPIYTLLHPGPESFNHAFGALVFVALIVGALASTIYLVYRLRSR
jgi:hypothetical protein